MFIWPSEGAIVSVSIQPVEPACRRALYLTKVIQSALQSAAKSVLLIKAERECAEPGAQ